MREAMSKSMGIAVIPSEEVVTFVGKLDWEEERKRHVCCWISSCCGPAARFDNVHGVTFRVTDMPETLAEHRRKAEKEALVAAIRIFMALFLF